MCNNKPSQTFFFDSGQVVDGQVLLTGAGVLTDLLQTLTTPSVGTEIRLKDGASKSGRIIVRLRPAGQHYFGGLNLEFQEGLWVEIDNPGPNFAAFTVGGYIADDSPDPLAIQMERLRDEITKSNQRLYDFLQGLYKGDPAT